MHLGILVQVRLFPMQILFAISIVSFLVLLWAAVAITRRIRASHKAERSSTTSQTEFSQYLFAAAEGMPSTSHTVAHHSAQNTSSGRSNQSTSYDKATSTERG